MLLSIFLIYALIVSAALALAGHHSREAVTREAQQRHPARVLIIGGTGGTGRQLIAQALERGYEVTALVRNPSKLAVTDPKLRVVQGDVLDKDSVDRAMNGQDAVLCALGHKRFFLPTHILS